ncbi:phosphoenolpyruvate synthase [Salinispora arenicola]|uniref:phosphoenolpyruvate synthase n=1 Tax=Salinispora arenicola TaxID=168697 RepID=UPI00036CA2B6|nr:phosphoenolpyruvate synthase [Salinispora arenicola]NIL43822.1 phosphoenolpyruvate synthase [Salinispora arenicola]
MSTVASETDVTKWRAMGAKASNLAAMRSLGVHVPRWSAVSSDVFTAFLEHVEGIDVLLTQGTEEPERVAAEVTRRMRATVIPDHLADPIHAAYQAAGGGRVAVRSSGLEEDGDKYSFAGQFDTFLNVSEADEVLDRVKDCWASAFSARSLTYRLRNGLPLRATGMGVLIQQMVRSEVSGVMFTADPATGAGDRYVVSAVYGLGEGIVSGAVDADTVTLEAATGTVLETELGDKSERYEPAAGGGVEAIEVPDADRAQLSLDRIDLGTLWEAGRAISDAFGAPQDIEWAVADGQLWILQSRPITTVPTTSRPVGELRIWDNSNIVESFRGITSPLTFTFASTVYGAVYESYARSLRVPEKQLAQMHEWLPALLGNFHGRVYYNLINWYRLQRIAPFYDVNRKLLEVAMGVDEALPDEIAEGLYPYEFDSAWQRRRARVVTYTTFFWKYLRMDRDVTRFVAYFYEQYAIFDKRDYAAMPADEVYRAFQDLIRSLNRRWGPMQMLDSTILLSMGILTMLGRRWLPHAPEWLTWAAARPGADVESAEPARELAALAATVKADDELRRLVTETDPAAIPDALAAAGHTTLLAAVDAYVEAHGYRSPDELKLEVPDLHEDPSSLYLMLRDALQAPPETASGDSAQEYLDQHLRGPRRWIYELTRRKVSRSLAARERLRFCRTKAFGSAKRMLRALGRHLQQVGAIERFEDVFLLRLDELTGAYEGKIAHDELRDIVAARRRTQERQATMSAPPRFRTYGAPYWEGNLEAAGWSVGRATRTGVGELRGTPSSPGVTTGRVVVTTRPQDVNGGIIVAYSTDPGWVAALPSATGLIIERGSPLTHVAIVARELGVPTIVKAKGATQELETGMTVRMDGGTGTITILNDTDGTSA